jgi:hypothetical protein
MSAQMKRLAMELIREVMTTELTHEQVSTKIGALIQHIWTGKVDNGPGDVDMKDSGNAIPACSFGLSERTNRAPR